MQLCQLGVEFPVNRYGEYIGYKTDHDPYARATSAGPLTSKQMTEVLQKEAQRLEVPILDGYYAVQLLKEAEQVCGVFCLKEGQPIAIRCGAVVLATGGPAGIYADSVYPEGHTGSTGLAISAGATLQNLALWQYGLASVRPRWNVSGTYMQVLPRFVSIDAQGQEHDFLWEYFRDKYEGLSLVFLKGYQWPFDPRKAENGSSLIDMLVYRERVEKGRSVYLDFTRNPFEIEFEKLSPEAYGYLQKAEDLLMEMQDYSAEALEDAALYYRDKANVLSRHINRDDSGVIFSSFEDLNKQAGEGFRDLTYERGFAIFSGDTSPVKELGWSDLYSGRGVTGMTVYLTGESAVNTQIPQVGLPFAICKEMAKRMMIYNDSEANFAAFLASTCHDLLSYEFQYSAYLMAYRAIYNTISSQDSITAREIKASLDASTSTLLKEDLDRYNSFFSSSQAKEPDILFTDLLVSWHIQEVVIPMTPVEDTGFDPMDETDDRLQDIVNKVA